ncbi:MAG: hypothetical protein HQK82_14205, partial [Desulfovibrionaceae bacterium]|nr:hypothetical protein [Desulfovibrionaceae bacterium]
YSQPGPDYFIAGTYETTVAKCGQKAEVKILPYNTRLVVNLSDFTVAVEEPIRHFVFDKQAVKTYDRWTEAFRTSLIKRSQNIRWPCFVSLSSGHDSGAVAAELADLGAKFHVYSMPAGEDKEVLAGRFEYLAARGIEVESIDPTLAESLEMRSYFLEKLDPYYLKNPLNPE